MRKEGGGEEEESRLESKSPVSDWKMLNPQQNKSTGTVEMTTREEEKKNVSDKRREKVSAHTGAEMIMKQLLGSCRDADHTLSHTGGCFQTIPVPRDIFSWTFHLKCRETNVIFLQGWKWRGVYLKWGWKRLHITQSTAEYLTIGASHNRELWHGFK